MANTKQTKKYLGGWDTSAYSDLAQASQQAYQTNWDILRNRYNTLMNEADRKESIARQNYANALSSQLSSDLQTQHAIDTNLADRGMSNSGARQRYLEQQLGAAGSNVNSALSNLLNTSLGIVSSGYGSLGDLLSGGTKLNAQQGADQLNILNNRIAADLEGQQLAASIAEADAQRAASGARSSSAEDEEYNEELRKLSIWSILNNIDPETGNTLNISDGEKAFMLYTLYDVADAKDIVGGFNSKILGKTATDEDTKEYKAVEKTRNKLAKYEKRLAKAESDIKNNKNKPFAVPERNAMIDLIGNTQLKLNEQLNNYYNTPEYKEKKTLERLNKMSLDDYYDMIYRKR